MSTVREVIIVRVESCAEAGAPKIPSYLLSPAWREACQISLPLQGKGGWRFVATLNAGTLVAVHPFSAGRLATAMEDMRYGVGLLSILTLAEPCEVRQTVRSGDDRRFKLINTERWRKQPLGTNGCRDRCNLAEEKCRSLKGSVMGEAERTAWVLTILPCKIRGRSVYCRRALSHLTPSQKYYWMSSPVPKSAGHDVVTDRVAGDSVPEILRAKNCTMKGERACHGILCGDSCC
jgi:hypothetical protein